MIAQHKMEQRSSGVQKGYEASYLRVLTPDSHESSAGLKPACCCIEQQKKIHVSRLGAISHLVINCYDSRTGAISASDAQHQHHPGCVQYVADVAASNLSTKCEAYCNDIWLQRQQTCFLMRHWHLHQNNQNACR